MIRLTILVFLVPCQILAQEVASDCEHDKAQISRAWIKNLADAHFDMGSNCFVLNSTSNDEFFKTIGDSISVELPEWWKQHFRSLKGKSIDDLRCFDESIYDGQSYLPDPEIIKKCVELKSACEIEVGSQKVTIPHDVVLFLTNSDNKYNNRIDVELSNNMMLIVNYDDTWNQNVACWHTRRQKVVWTTKTAPHFVNRTGYSVQHRTILTNGESVFVLSAAKYVATIEKLSLKDGTTEWEFTSQDHIEDEE